MTIAAEDRGVRVPSGQHIVLEGMSWEFYEHLLAEVGDRPLRVTYLDGVLEIMAPLGEHESARRHIGTLIVMLCLELDIRWRSFGSTTFREKGKQGGLEPDDCYYFGANADRTAGLSRFDAKVHPAPDLAIEIEVTRSAIPRLDVYRRLGVRELWRHNGKSLTVLHLRGAAYKASTKSLAFPQLSMATFAKFLARMDREDTNTVLREFRTWVNGLSK